jgi:hypothetical protein
MWYDVCTFRSCFVPSTQWGVKRHVIAMGLPGLGPIISSFDWAALLAGARLTAELDALSVQSLVQQLRQKAQPGSIGVLRMVGHGQKDPNGRIALWVGGSPLVRETLDPNHPLCAQAGYRPLLASLSSYFRTNGLLILEYCFAGQDRQLLQLLADVLRVRVAAWTGHGWLGGAINDGSLVMVAPQSTPAQAG